MLSVGAESVGVFGRGGLASGRWDIDTVAKRSGNGAQHAFTCATAVRPPRNQVRGAVARTLARTIAWAAPSRWLPNPGTWARCGSRVAHPQMMSQVVLGSAGKALSLIDLARPGRIVTNINVDDPVSCVASTRLVAAGTSTGMVNLYDGHLRVARAVHSFRAHAHGVGAVAAKRDLVVSCGASKQLGHGPGGRCGLGPPRCVFGWCQCRHARPART